MSVPLLEFSEREWDARLFSQKGLATLLGWQSHWTFLAKGSRAGFPDRTLAKGRIVFAELKRQPRIGKRGQPLKEAYGVTDAQRGWLDRLARAAGEVYVWRPADEQEVARVLGAPWAFLPRGFEDGRPRLHRAGEEDWTPGSLWIPDVGRADGAEV